MKREFASVSEAVAYISKHCGSLGAPWNTDTPQDEYIEKLIKYIDEEFYSSILINGIEFDIERIVSDMVALCEEQYLVHQV